MRKIAFRIGGVGVIACASLLSAVLYGCASDDATITPTPSREAGPDSTPSDGPAAESSSADASKDVKEHDVTEKDVKKDVSEHDAQHEDAGPPLVQLCDVLDKIFNIVPEGGEPDACLTSSPDICGLPYPNSRGGTWMTAIWTNFLISSELNCDIRAYFLATENGGVLGYNQFEYYSNVELINNMYLFLGCPIVNLPDAGEPDAGDAGGGPEFPLGVIPSALAGTVFTTADVDLIAHLFAQSIYQAVANADNDAGMTLTTAQVDSIHAKLEYEVAQMGAQKSASYSDPTCDAGASDAGSDAKRD